MTPSNFFSTAGMEGQQSVEYWRHVMAEVYFRLDIQSAHADRLRAELLCWKSDVLRISNCKADVYRIIRRREAAKGDKTEGFIFAFPTRHPVRFEQRGREGLALPGSVYILNTAEPFVVDQPDAWEGITLQIDRERLAGRIAGIDDLCASVDFSSPLLVPTITTLGEQVLKLQPSEHSARIEECIIDLLCLMIECRDQRDNGALLRETLGRIGMINPHEVGAASAAASSAQPGWAAKAAEERAAVFERESAFGREIDRDIANAARRIAALSTREREVLDRLLEGRPNKWIAYDLGISVRTVEIHRARMMKRLRARRLAEVIRLGVMARLKASSTRSNCSGQPDFQT
jgi:DNA-binding CsgD family transcriptional regulator